MDFKIYRIFGDTNYEGKEEEIQNYLKIQTSSMRDKV